MNNGIKVLFFFEKNLPESYFDLEKFEDICRRQNSRVLSFDFHRFRTHNQQDEEVLAHNLIQIWIIKNIRGVGSLWGLFLQYLGKVL